MPTGNNVSATGKLVLVIDDASLVRLYYRSILEQAGFRIEEALNGLEAQEKLLVLKPDLVVVDINMPHMDGLTFLEALRRKPAPLSTIPALVISTEAGQDDFEAARRAGANWYLIKPAAGDSLVEHARMLCGIAHE